MIKKPAPKSAVSNIKELDQKEAFQKPFNQSMLDKQFSSAIKTIETRYKLYETHEQTRQAKNNFEKLICNELNCAFNKWNDNEHDIIPCLCQQCGVLLKMIVSLSFL